MKMRTTMDAILSAIKKLYIARGLSEQVYQLCIFKQIMLERNDEFRWDSTVKRTISCWRLVDLTVSFVNDS